MSKKNKGGRPKKGPAEKLKYRVSFMLRTEDYYPLKAKAESVGLRLAEFARLAVIGCPVQSRITPKEAGWLRMLSGMANNLNQLARQAHKSGYDDLRSANITLGIDIHNLIKRFRHDGQNNKG